MSGVLDRMALRVLGVLPAVEPLVAPGLAPTVDSLADMAVEREAAVALAAGPQRKTPHLQPGETQDSAVSTRQEPALSATRLQAARREEWARSPEAQREGTGAPVLKQAGALPEDSHATFKDADDRERPQSLALKAMADESVLSPIPAAMIVRKSTGSEEDADRSANRETAEPATARVTEVRGDSGAHIDLPGAPGEQRTEIHISIGSIELRAPRPDARPQPVPFRPQVALGEYLRGKPEAGA